MLGVPEPPSCRVQAYLGVSWLWEFGPTSGVGSPSLWESQPLKILSLGGDS